MSEYLDRMLPVFDMGGVDDTHAIVLCNVLSDGIKSGVFKEASMEITIAAFMYNVVAGTIALKGTKADMLVVMDRAYDRMAKAEKRGATNVS